MRVVNVLLGGPTDLLPKNLMLNEVDADWIGVDRGSLRLIENGIIPSIAIGDFDSLKADELEKVRSKVKDIRYFNPVKDYTDSQLGIKIANESLHADFINVYGATGGRLDHFFANFLMFLSDEFKNIAPKVRIIDTQNDIRYFLPGQYTLHKILDKKYLAFIPLTEMNLTLNDEKYTLNNFHVNHPISFSSNEFLGDIGHFSFDNGMMCVIQSKD
ncbi:thiamine diphosphokinase [Apilactobacillus sp. M161]|uniref:Thiamine diphosphokinase n=1 Tax=Apilactobacillus xinyiensis TaxID=2841032 RepID=A0ABT0I0W4_9LACO|nr:thiamine diphosphokinase [Apilactobacillus xinyiensis]MCK8624161.1 thiamine diphosphokinase [Apilactobacillus xinyiensis]